MFKLYARDTQNKPKILAHEYFKELLKDNESYDYQFVDIKVKNLMVIGGFDYHIPAFIELCKDKAMGKFINSLSKDETHFFQQTCSWAIEWDSPSFTNHT